MLIATLLRDDGRKALVLGLREDDIRQLVSGRLEVSLDEASLQVSGFEGWDMWVLGPDATDEFSTHYETAVEDKPE